MKTLINNNNNDNNNVSEVTLLLVIVSSTESFRCCRPMQRKWPIWRSRLRLSPSCVSSLQPLSTEAQL